MMEKEISIRELRELQLNILDKIHSFCIGRGIRYSLGGGTLLGAVRHGGYIPWDDDVDIMLPRPDYEIFLKEFGCTYPELRVQNAITDPEYHQPFTKIIDRRTVLKENLHFKELSLESGVFVDVFPVDGLPATAELAKFEDKLNDWRRAVIYTSPAKKVIGKYQFLKYIYNIFLTHETAVRKRDEFMSSIDFETARFAGAISGRYGQKEHMDADVFRNYMDIKFEGRVYRCISDYDAYLTKHYGDYMQMPPKEKQVREHDFKAWWR